VVYREYCPLTCERFLVSLCSVVCLFVLFGGCALLCFLCLQAREAKYKWHAPKLGADKAETLSMIWSNMFFMKARYPEKVEMQVLNWGGLEQLQRVRVI
jgi:hypothetical protein